MPVVGKTADEIAARAETFRFLAEIQLQQDDFKGLNISFSPESATICQSASDRAPRSASKGDPLVLRFERLAFAPSELVGVAETGRARVDV